MEQAQDQRPSNPADRPLVTFDNNVVISLRNNDSDADLARRLLALSRAGVIIAATTLSTALEEQRPGQDLTMHDYAVWLEAQGFARGYIFFGPRTIGFRLPGDPLNTIILDGRLERNLVARVHQILFPEVSFNWYEYRDQAYERLGIVGTGREALLELESLEFPYIPPSPQALQQRPTPTLDTVGAAERAELQAIYKSVSRKWMNKKNDALGLYNHMTQAVNTAHPEHAVFVTNDGNFYKETKLPALRQLGFPGEILRLAQAVDFIYQVKGAQE